MMCLLTESNRLLSFSALLKVMRSTGFIFLGKLDDDAENLAVRLTVEIILGENFQRAVDGAVFQEDAAEDGLLGLQILRRNFV